MKNGILKSRPGAPLKRIPFAPGPCINSPAVGFCFGTPPGPFVSSDCGVAFHIKNRNAPPCKIGSAGGHRYITLPSKKGQTWGRVVSPPWPTQYWGNGGIHVMALLAILSQKDAVGYLNSYIGVMQRLPLTSGSGMEVPRFPLFICT